MVMRIDILTIFPNMFSPFEESIIKRARENGIIDIRVHNIRDYSRDKHKKVDDYPFGGGAGMVMMVEPIAICIEEVKKLNKGKVVFLGPRGETFNQDMARDFSKEEEIIFLCGHYEGIDERVYSFIDCEISLGDFILTGGEMAAIPIIDSIARLIPGVLSSSESLDEESFSNNTLEYPQYTKPREFRGLMVPDVLLSGHHSNIKKWRYEESLKITNKFRPDLFLKNK